MEPDSDDRIHCTLFSHIIPFQSSGTWKLILDSQLDIVSDFEVFDFLRELREQKDGKDGKARDKRDKGKDKVGDDAGGDVQSIDYQVREAKDEVCLVPSRSSTEPRPLSLAQLRKYLGRRPCSQQSEEQIISFLNRMREFKLTSFEKLQFLNVRPTSVVDIFNIVENCEGRFSEEDIQRMMDVVEEELPFTPAQ